MLENVRCAAFNMTKYVNVRRPKETRLVRRRYLYPVVCARKKRSYCVEKKRNERRVRGREREKQRQTRGQRMLGE